MCRPPISVAAVCAERAGTRRSLRLTDGVTLDLDPDDRADHDRPLQVRPGPRALDRDRQT
ncbi:hypothetical protein [Spongiactinospora sp. 9N601]|uniref:hypothetical protein n=1 Tax=Spongiactinospora sp. 9N601 TaxID=3375149 RepID=UPI003792C01F